MSEKVRDSESHSLNRSFPQELQSLFEEIKIENRSRLEEKLFDFMAAMRIEKEAASSPNLEGCLRILVDRIADLMSVEIISLMLMDKERGDLVVKLAKGLNDEVVKETRIKIGESVSGWIAQTGQPLLIEDITKDTRFKIKGGRYYTNSLLSVPLKFRDRVIGVINVNNKASREVFRQADLEVLNTIAELASLAIENSRIQEESKALEKLKGEFLSNITHELRTPLATVKETVVMLLDEIAGAITKDQRKFLEIARNNIERLGRLVDGLLEIAKSDAQKPIMKRTRFDAVALVRSVADSLKALIDKNGLTLECALPSQEIMVWGDLDRLTQVLTNLVDNAIKYNSVSGRVRLEIEDASEAVRIKVADTGKGIPESEREKIFDRFYRVDSDEVKQVKGAGLGLYICSQIVGLHKGTLTVESEVGRGSVFCVTLPKDLRKSRDR